MAEYESYINKECKGNDYSQLAQSFRRALMDRNLHPGDLPEQPTNTKIKASDIEMFRSKAYEIINYSSFIGQITEGMQAKHEHMECISQATSDINNLLRCRSGCIGNCQFSCTAYCYASCDGNSHHNGSCSYMTWYCSGDCNNYCTGCSGACEYSCGQSCNDYCVSSCKNSSISSANRLPGTMVSV